MRDILEKANVWNHGVSKEVVEEGYQIMADELRKLEQSLTIRIEEHVKSTYESQVKEIQTAKTVFKQIYM